MNPSKAWAMLAARGSSPGRVGRGRPQLTPAEIARLLHGLERGPFLMGMAMETSDVAGVPELEQHLESEIWSLGHERHWAVSMNDRELYYPRFAGLAVFEALNPRPEGCSMCHNRGFIHSRAQPVPCTDCGQTGGHSLSAHRRSYLVGIAWTSWRESWAARYEHVYAVACGWHGDALSHLRRALESL